VEPRPGIPPNPRHVAQVLAQARRDHVRLVLQESFYPTSTSELIATRANASLVVLPGGPDFAHGKTYVDFIGQLVRALERGASGASGAGGNAR
jgi:zinc/manganese transport system substrate-binding protein